MCHAPRANAGAGDLPMTHGVVAVSRRLGVVDAALGSTLDRVASLEPTVRCVDGLGHRRSVYRPLLESTLRRSAGRLRQTSDDPSPIEPTGTNAQRLAEVVLGELGSTASERPAMSRLIESQLDDGTYLRVTSADNPEPVWYYESILLHAVGLHAAETRQVSAFESMRRGARRFAREVQPDHASNQPWAMHAFLLEPDAIPLADMMLHAAGIQHPASMDVVSLILLSESLEAIDQLEGAGS
jgi:hypothetical protein